MLDGATLAAQPDISPCFSLYRKRRCGAEEPICRQCVAYGTTCDYVPVTVEENDRLREVKRLRRERALQLRLQQQREQAHSASASFALSLTTSTAPKQKGPKANRANGGAGPSTSREGKKQAGAKGRRPRAHTLGTSTAPEPEFLTIELPSVLRPSSTEGFKHHHHPHHLGATSSHGSADTYTSAVPTPSSTTTNSFDFHCAGEPAEPPFSTVPFLRLQNNVSPLPSPGTDQEQERTSPPHSPLYSFLSRYSLPHQQQPHHQQHHQQQQQQHATKMLATGVNAPIQPLSDLFTTVACATTTAAVEMAASNSNHGFPIFNSSYHMGGTHSGMPFYPTLSRVSSHNAHTPSLSAAHLLHQQQAHQHHHFDDAASSTTAHSQAPESIGACADTNTASSIDTISSAQERQWHAAQGLVERIGDLAFHHHSHGSSQPLHLHLHHGQAHGHGQPGAPHSPISPIFPHGGLALSPPPLLPQLQLPATAYAALPMDKHGESAPLHISSMYGGAGAHASGAFLDAAAPSSLDEHGHERNSIDVEPMSAATSSAMSHYAHSPIATGQQHAEISPSLFSGATLSALKHDDDDAAAEGKDEEEEEKYSPPSPETMHKAHLLPRLSHANLMMHDAQSVKRRQHTHNHQQVASGLGLQLEAA